MKCRGKMAMDMCNCIPHFYPFLDGPKCSPSGYECLLDFKWPGWSLSLCNCTRTCVELKYTVHNIIKRNWDAGSNITFATKASFNLEIMPPKVRNRISVVFSFEDLLVSFGGAASLFLGFSFWNVVRAIYYWFNELFVYLMQFTSRRHKEKPGTVEGTTFAK
ncbi:uncharacterized protein LOC119657305 [Hermetia illucens]|uniref:uncharacterized protein LOC119657305 n=1 Tax=Hermetia illucens TaxID=343691 RepID=UPI0018CBFEC4|nr:uncharacterized protein LOC119657305 [Hermetia illucens]